MSSPASLFLKLTLADFKAGEADQSPQHPKACAVAIMSGGRSGNVYMHGFTYCRSKTIPLRRMRSASCLTSTILLSFLKVT